MFRLSTILLSEIASGNQEFVDTLLPHLKPEFFVDKADLFDRTIFKILSEHQERYNAPPTLEQAQITLQKVGLDESAYARATEQLTALYQPHPPRQFDWLKDNVIEYVRSRSYEIALDLAESAKERHKDPRPHIEEALDALNFTIDETQELDLDLDPEAIFESFKQSVPKQPIESLSRWPHVARGELAVILAPVTAGKSAALVHLTCDYLKQGLNVLFLTLEMSSRLTRHRVLANLLQHDVNTVDKLTAAEIRKGKENYPSLGQLLIRKFEGEKTTHTGQFEDHIKKLKRKRNFVPDVLVIDYLSECGSKKLSHGKNTTTYDYVGACTGELRALAVKYNTITWTATQTNRAGYDSEPDMKNTSDSAQVNHKADVIVGICPLKDDIHSLRTSVIKMRDGQKPEPFMTGADFLTMTLSEFDDPVLESKRSEEFNKKLEKVSMFKRASTASAGLRNGK